MSRAQERAEERVDELINQLADSGIGRVRASDRSLLEIARHDDPVGYYRWLVLRFGDRPSFLDCKGNREKATRSMRAMRASAGEKKNEPENPTAEKKPRRHELIERDPLTADECKSEYSRQILAELSAVGICVLLPPITWAEFVNRSADPNFENHEPVRNYMEVAASGRRWSIQQIRAAYPYRFRAPAPEKEVLFQASKSDIAVSRGLIHVARYLITQSSQDEAFKALAKSYLSQLHLPPSELLRFQPVQNLRQRLDERNTELDAEHLDISLPVVLGDGEANCRLFLVALFRSALYFESSLVVTPGDDRMPNTTFLSDPLSAMRLDLKKFTMFKSDHSIRNLGVNRTELSWDRLLDISPEIESKPRPKRQQHFRGSWSGSFVSSFCRLR